MPTSNPILCSRCKSVDVVLEEQATAYLTHYPDDLDGYQNPGEIKKVAMNCNACGAHYTLRRFGQFDDELRERLAANLPLLLAERAAKKATSVSAASAPQ